MAWAFVAAPWGAPGELGAAVEICRPSAMPRRACRRLTTARAENEQPRKFGLSWKYPTSDLLPRKFDKMLAALCAGELSLGILGHALSRVTGNFAPYSAVSFAPADLGIGLLYTAPLVLVGLSLSFLPFDALKKVTRLSREAVTTILTSKSALEIFLFCASAGIGEELLFRNSILISVENATGSELNALLISSALFGVTHFASLTYAVLSGLAGIYFGLEFLQTDGNVGPAIVTHTLYDLLFVLFVLSTTPPTDTNKTETEPID